LVQQRRHVGPRFLARLLLAGRQLGDGRRVAVAGEVGNLLPVLERLANAGVFLGVVGELGLSVGITRRSN